MAKNFNLKLRKSLNIESNITLKPPITKNKQKGKLTERCIAVIKGRWGGSARHLGSRSAGASANSPGACVGFIHIHCETKKKKNPGKYTYNG